VGNVPRHALPRQVLERGSPLPLSDMPVSIEGGRGLPHSKTLARERVPFMISSPVRRPAKRCAGCLGRQPRVPFDAIAADLFTGELIQQLSDLPVAFRMHL
jgi:hypothetical protein